MTLFSRRTLQGTLDHLRPLLTDPKRRSIAAALNSKRLQENLGAQWELLFFGALASLGSLIPEPPTSGSRSVDALFALSDAPENTVAIEIATITNAHVMKLNPYDELIECITRESRRFSIPPRGWHFDISARSEKIGRRITTTLAIPRPAEHALFIAEHLKPMLLEIRASPNVRHSRKVKDRDWDLTILYDPEKDFIGASYLGVFDTSSLRQNSLFRALENKAEQIRGSGHPGASVIAACDGGEPTFRQSPSTHSVTAARVANEFLKGHPEIAAVILASTFRKGKPLRGQRPYIEVLTNETARVGLDDRLYSTLNDLGDFFPLLQSDGLNVRHHHRYSKGKKGFNHFGAPLWLKRGREAVAVRARVSSRGLVEHLAEDRGASAALHIGTGNPFRDAVRLGDQLIAVRFLHDPENDDDWIEFVFEGRDPATSPIEP